MSSELWLGFGLPTGLLFLSVLLILLRVAAISHDAGGMANTAEQRSIAARVVEVGVGEYALLVQRYQIWDCYWWAHSPESQAQLQEAIRSATHGEVVREDVEVRMAGGRLMWVDFQLAALRDDDGRVTHLIPSGFDISARKEAERAVRTSERLQRLAIEAGGIGYWDWDLENDEILWGPGARALYVRDTPPNAESADDAMLPILSEDRQRAVDLALAAVAEGQLYQTEFRVVWPDGSVHWLYARGEVSERGPDGAPTHMIGVNLDITARKEAEAALIESEKRFRTLANKVPAMLWVTDGDNQCTFLNSEWFNYTGQTEEEGLGMGWLDAIHPDDRDSAVSTFLKAAERREPFDVDYRLRTATGEYRWGANSGRPRFAADGAFRGYIGAVVDIHDRMEAMQALRESERQGRLLMEVVQNSPDFIGVSTLDGKQKFVNSTFLEYFGVADYEAIADSWADLVHPDDSVAYVEHFYERVRDRRPFHGEVRFRLADGTWPWMQAWGRLRFGVDNTYDGHIGVSADITQRKQAVESLKNADRQKDEFLATLAHELRNPLAPIRSGLELMKLKTGDPDSLEQIRATMERQTEQLVVLVDDLLDIARITRGALELRRSRIRLGDVIQAAVESSRWLIDAGRHNLTVELPQESVYVDADPHRMAQVVSNLLNNAAKYTPEGVNKGSEFCVRLPTAGPPEALASDAGAAESSVDVETGRRVLVVDDNQAAREMLVMVLESMGYVVRPAADGVEAIEAAEAFRPDAMLLDLGMPRMGGYEAARKIRQQGWGGKIRLIALTGWGQEADKRRTQEAGFDHHLLKAVKASDLRPVLDLPRRENV